MKCPHCSKDISEKLVLQEAARIQGRKSRRTLTPEQARSTALKRWDKKEESNDAED
jgi:hypothetical protein